MDSSRLWIVGLAVVAACTYDASKLKPPATASADGAADQRLGSSDGMLGTGGAGDAPMTSLTDAGQRDAAGGGGAGGYGGAGGAGGMAGVGGTVGVLDVGLGAGGADGASDKPGGDASSSAACPSIQFWSEAPDTTACGPSYAWFHVQLASASTPRNNIETCKLSITDENGAAVLSNYVLPTVSRTDDAGATIGLKAGCALGFTNANIGYVDYFTSPVIGALRFQLDAYDSNGIIVQTGSTNLTAAQSYPPKIDLTLRASLVPSGGTDGPVGTSTKSAFDVAPVDNTVPGWTIDRPNNKNADGSPMSGATKQGAEGLIDGAASPFYLDPYAPKLFLWQVYVNNDAPAAPDGAYVSLYILEMPSAEQASGLYASLLQNSEYERKVGTPDDWKPTSPLMGTNSRIQDTASRWWINFHKDVFYVEVSLYPSTGSAPDYTPSEPSLKQEALRFAQGVADRI
jgi:hypothetical protein